MSVWNKIKLLYFDLFGYPGDMVELVAASPILKLVAMGVDNNKIMSELDVSISDIAEEIKTWMDEPVMDNFVGWDHKLTFNPVVVYRVSKNKSEYIMKLDDNSDSMFDKDISWHVAKLYYKHKQTLEERWL